MIYCIHIRRMYCLNWCHSEKKNGIFVALDDNDQTRKVPWQEFGKNLMAITMPMTIFMLLMILMTTHLRRSPWSSWWLGRLNWSRHLPLILATVLYQASHMCKDSWPLIKNHNPSSPLLQTRFQPEWHLSFLHKSYSPPQSLAQCGWHLFFLVNYLTYLTPHTNIGHLGLK